MALIYVLEDDVNIREIEEIALKNSNYQVRSYERASDFYRGIKKELPDLILLDIMLPDEDGYSIIRKLRGNALTRKIPLIAVTAKTSEMDMVKGLDEGADDYIKKPFSLMELLSRVKALLRRTTDEKQQVMDIGMITMDHEKRSVCVKDRAIDLTYKEYELLRYLMNNKETVLTREAIMQIVWGTDYEGETRTVDMHIKTLRQKLGDAGKQIRTVRNVGYVLEMDVEG